MSRTPQCTTPTRQCTTTFDNGSGYAGLVDLGPLDVLTKREIEVLALVDHGVPLKSVAKQLGVAQRTVEGYCLEAAHQFHR